MGETWYSFFFCCSIAGNGLESVLHISDVTGDDYDGVFKCSADNGNWNQPSRTFLLKYSECGTLFGTGAYFLTSIQAVWGSTILCSICSMNPKSMQIRISIDNGITHNVFQVITLRENVFKIKLKIVRSFLYINCLGSLIVR